MAPLRLSFLIRSKYEQLSPKNNLFKWKKESDFTCPLCNDKPQSLEHVLSSSKTTFGNGRYSWRHNRVLEELVKFIKNYMKSEPTISTQKFVSESGRIYGGSEQTINHRDVPGQNLLGSSGNREVSADIPGWHNDYSKTISSKSLRPDIVFLTRANLKIIVVELSIIYESRMDQIHVYKTIKYEYLKKKELEKEGYSVKVVEVETRGFVAGALYQFLSQIGIKRCNRGKCIKRLIEITGNSSMWIWNKKKNIPWNNSK